MIYDILVIGAGPAGLMAAGRAAELGARVALLEKNNRPGVKLLMTGHGRCNLTNLSGSEREFAARLGPSGKFLFSALHRFGPAAVVDFFQGRGVATKVEAGGRVFPAADRATAVLKALSDYAAAGQVESWFDCPVRELKRHGRRIGQAVLADGRSFEAKAVIICTGGRSYPATGSTGDGQAWLSALGHRVAPLRPSLAPFVVAEPWVRALEGLSLTEPELALHQADKKIAARRGPAVFTADGLSGPAVFDLNPPALAAGFDRLELRLDLEPELTLAELDLKLEAAFRQAGKKMVKNSLAGLLPPKMLPLVLGLAGFEPEQAAATAGRAPRRRLAQLIKGLSFTVTGTKGYDQAMVTAGGVALEEVDPRTMRSKLFDNLYLAGEVLDLQGPTGGYNLQIGWSTGFVAGESAAASLGFVSRA